MNIQGSDAKYVERSNQASGVIIDTFASAMRSRLDFWKSVWQIASRPYASTAIASIVEENFDRASELTNLTLGEFQSRVQRTADFSQKFLAHVGKLQGATLETYRDVSIVDRVKDAPTEMSANGFKYRETPADPVSVTN